MGKLLSLFLFAATDDHDEMDPRAIASHTVRKTLRWSGQRDFREGCHGAAGLR